MTSTNDLRRGFLDYLASEGHAIVPSASLVSDDPTLLFTVAGMVPFVPYLTGLVPAPYPRATSVQKCIRTLDIEEVGKTTRHGTFFQMNCNFSFGDYFKEGAIELAWELITRAQGDRSRLAATCSRYCTCRSRPGSYSGLVTAATSSATRGPNRSASAASAALVWAASVVPPGAEGASSAA